VNCPAWIGIKVPLCYFIDVEETMDRYNEDLDYLSKDLDITSEELEEIIHEADTILTGRDTDAGQKTVGLLKKAQALQNAGRFDESREYTEQALELNPEMPEALVRLGNIYAKEKKYGKALEYITKSIAVNNKYSYAYFMRGNAYSGMGEYVNAVEDYNRAIELKPDYTKAYNNRGIAYTGMEDYGKAVADYSRAVELKPDFAAAYYNRGNAYYRTGERYKAIADYDIAIELKPDYAAAYYNRGLAYDDMGEYGKAAADYNRAVELHSDDTTAYNNRHLAYDDMDERDKAAADYNRAVELQAGLAEAYYNRSLISYIKGEYDKAFRDELKCMECLQNRQNDDIDIIAKIQQIIVSIIKNSEKLDFIWDHTKKELEQAPNFFLRIIASFIGEGFTEKKHKDLVNAVIKLWKKCYGVYDKDAVILYQYTSMPVLQAMFDSQRLRLSPTSYLNDPNEGRTVFAYLKEKAKKETLKMYLEKIQEKGSTDTIFVRSFTVNEDKLAMWYNSYADSGCGVSVGIPALLVSKGQRTPDLASLTINAGTPNSGIGKQKEQPIPLELLGLFKIEYDRNCVKEISDCLAKFNNNDFKNDKLAELIAQLFVPVAALIKNEDYQHENEYRLVYIASWEDTILQKYIKQTPEDGVYIETEKVLFERFNKFKDDYPDEEYVEVYMGPKVNKIVCSKCFDSFRHKYPGVKIKPSSIKWQ
jgi:tetratricopeptide (TPR) repeat protein